MEQTARYYWWQHHKSIIEKIKVEIEKQLNVLPRKDIAAKALNKQQFCGDGKC